MRVVSSRRNFSPCSALSLKKRRDARGGHLRFSLLVGPYSHSNIALSSHRKRVRDRKQCHGLSVASSRAGGAEYSKKFLSSTSLTRNEHVCAGGVEYFKKFLSSTSLARNEHVRAGGAEYSKKFLSSTSLTRNEHVRAGGAEYFKKFLSSTSLTRNEHFRAGGAEYSKKFLSSTSLTRNATSTMFVRAP